jgi:hypothetical protein
MNESQQRLCVDFFTHIDAPSEGGNGSAYNRILVDGDNFCVGENLEGLFGCGRKLVQEELSNV